MSPAFREKFLQEPEKIADYVVVCHLEKDLVKYIRKHTFLVTVLITAAFLLLAFGEYFLYRKTKELNKMISEGVMQIKEVVKLHLTLGIRKIQFTVLLNN